MTSLNPVFTVGNQLKEAIELHTDRKGKEAEARAIEDADSGWCQRTGKACEAVTPTNCPEVCVSVS